MEIVIGLVCVLLLVLVVGGYAVTDRMLQMFRQKRGDR